MDLNVALEDLIDACKRIAVAVEEIEQMVREDLEKEESGAEETTSFP